MHNLPPIFVSWFSSIVYVFCDAIYCSSRLIGLNQVVIPFHFLHFNELGAVTIVLL